MNIEDLNKYRLAIINKEGNLFAYERKTGELHQECLEKYGKSQNKETTNIETLVKDGHCLFYNLNNKNFYTLLPNELDTMQQYTLEYLTNYMENIREMTVEYIDGTSIDLKNNIPDKFCKIALQRYYDKKDSKKSCK